MQLGPYILLVLKSFQPFMGDTETFAEREERLSMTSVQVTRAVDVLTCTDQPDGCKRRWAGTRQDLGLLLAVTAKFESNLAQHIHEDRCKVNECDSYRLWIPAQKKYIVLHKAASMWQLHANYSLPVEVWNQTKGTSPEATYQAAYQAGLAFSRAYGLCKTVQGAISNYALGSGCSWVGAPERYAKFLEVKGTGTEQLEARVERWKAAALKREEEPDKVADASQPTS
jgi:hypothetical protein